MARINFVSFTFLFAFGLGSFVGIALALLAVALATPEPEPTVIVADAAVADAATLTPTATLTATPPPTETPVPSVRTRSTLNVRIGPAEGFAVLGTLADGSEIDVQGRDVEGDWVAIEFPPGSSARGWIPSGQVEGLTLVQIMSLGVLQATLIETTPRFPFTTPTPATFDGAFSTPTAEAGTERGPPALGTPDETGSATPRPGTPTPTPTPAVSIGPTDLAIAGVSEASGGNVRVVVENLGPGDVPWVTVDVSAAGYATETMTFPGTVLAGETVTLQTDELELNAAALVTVEVDPEGMLTDLDRSNNSLTLELSP